NSTASFCLEPTARLDAHRVVRDSSYRVRVRTPLLCRLLTSSFPAKGAPVARVIVDVMPKPEILDPQGKAVHGALGRMGFDAVSDVRQGKRFELTVATADEATRSEERRVGKEVRDERTTREKKEEEDA